MPKIGEIYNKKYELQELVGGGNYSEVYKAKEIKSGEIVAIKIIDVAQTVLREGKIYDAISNAKLSDGITPLLDKDNKNKVPEYFVFPYREAGSLSGRIKNLDYELKISYSIKLLETLSSLHDADIIHRDLKPQNILIDDEGLPEITDFGIGKTIFTTLSGSTQGTIAGGTRNYGAPEQFEKGAATDKYTDVFAMSKLLYEILSGGESLTSVFEDNNLVEIRYTSPLSNFDKRFSSYVDDVIKKGLSLDPKERYKDGKELQVALLAAIAKKDNPLKPVIDFTKKNVRNLAISTSLAAAVFLGILFWDELIPEPEIITEEKTVEVIATPTPLAKSGEGLSGSLSTEGGETTITIEPTPTPFMPTPTPQPTSKQLTQPTPQPTPEPTPEPNQPNPIISKPFGEKEFPDGTFHLGSTYDEVISAMGEPNNPPPEEVIQDSLSVFFKRGNEYNGYIRYRDEVLNESRIYFYDEKVIAWEDKGDLKLYDFKIETNDTFNLGSSITEVLQIQGNPKTISIDTINVNCCAQIPRVWIYDVEDEFQDASISFSSVWYYENLNIAGSPDEFDYVVEEWDQVKSFLQAPKANFGPSPSIPLPQPSSPSPEPQVSNPQPQQQSTPQQSTPQPTATPVPPQQSTPQQSTPAPQPTATPIPQPTATPVPQLGESSNRLPPYISSLTTTINVISSSNLGPNIGHELEYHAGDDSIYVADHENGKVRVFDRFLNETNSFNVSGTLRNITSYTPDRVIYTISSVGGNTQKIIKSNVLGEEIISWNIEGFSRGMETDSFGNLYVVLGNEKRILKYDPSGNLLTEWATDTTSCGNNYDPKGLSIDSSNNVYIVIWNAAGGNNSCVKKYDSSGNFIRLWGIDPANEYKELYGAMDTVIDEFDNVYVITTGGWIDQGQIKKYSKDGEFIALWKIDGLLKTQSESSMWFTYRPNNGVFFSAAWTSGKFTKFQLIGPN